MTPRTTGGRVASVVAGQVITVLIAAIVVLGALATLPTLKARTAGTATRVQERVHIPLVATSELKKVR